MTRPPQDARRRQILEAARRLLVRRGFQDVVLDDVARQAGVAKGTLFLYYSSKEELLAAAFAELVDQLGEALEDLRSSPLRGRRLLSRMVRTILTHFERNRDFMSQFGAGKFPGCGERACKALVGRMGQNMRRVLALLRASARDLGGFPVTEYAAVALFGLCRSAMMHKLISGHEAPLQTRTERVVDMFLDGARGGA